MDNINPPPDIATTYARLHEVYSQLIDLLPIKCFQPSESTDASDKDSQAHKLQRYQPTQWLRTSYQYRMLQLQAVGEQKSSLPKSQSSLQDLKRRLHQKIKVYHDYQTMKQTKVSEAMNPDESGLALHIETTEPEVLSQLTKREKKSKLRKLHQKIRRVQTQSEILNALPNEEKEHATIQHSMSKALKQLSGQPVQENVQKIRKQIRTLQKKKQKSRQKWQERREELEARLTESREKFIEKHPKRSKSSKKDLTQKHKVKTNNTPLKEKIHKK